MKEAEAIKEQGISVFHSKTSEAFMLIAFMIGDLIFVYRNIPAPVDLDLYSGLNEKSFVELKNKILQKQTDHEHSHLTLAESVFLYMLVDVVCKSFVDDANETLKKLGVQNLKITEEEYDILRINFLRYGQLMIEKMNQKFEKNDFFKQSLEKLKNWNSER